MGDILKMTKNDLVNYIKEELGAPVLNIEVTDKQIENQIDKAIQKFTEFAYDSDFKKYIKFNCTGRGMYDVDPRVKTITKISKGGSLFTAGFSNYIPNSFINLIHGGMGAALGMLISISSTRAQMDHYLYDGIHYEYNYLKNKLTIYEDFNGPLLIEAYTEYIPDEHDGIYNHIWVKAYSTELVRLLWANNVGKYSQSIIGGATINYADIKSQAESALEKLEEDLLETWSDVPPIHIG